MPVDLSVKRVPDEIAERLRARAKRNHRSLQGELRAILEGAAQGADRRGVDVVQESDPLFVDPARGSRVIAPHSESALMIREDREGRTFTVRDLYDYVSTLGQGTPDESTGWIRQGRSSR
jgi:plasmid stability protein